ncbi:hypothetical protein CCR75_003985 [Bremia lactucae]|uniref:NADH dehydrogenase n=1 Tax=Bremia lactucae TaxID=4779 RepID=A0A976FP33_BRELC|nr:hypothetical protein CCR75_003985 [Bremia lactucae]
MWTRQLINVTKTARSTSTSWWKRAPSSMESHQDESKQTENFQLVIVGTGWAGYQLFTQCRKHLVDIEESVGRRVDLVVVSKRNVS